jgi:nitroimidazol reductase NimA-like FMN-containing flavoprotein (pyridoxamine 5'-phosphate oxidase superfamily)
MSLIDGRTWLEILSLQACWELLAAEPVGRVGVTVDGAPEIYPVNHAVDGRTIVFRTDPGTKLRGLERNPLVCFEVDGYDADTQVGWSVLVKGRAREALQADEVHRAEQLPITPWALGRKAHWMKVDPIEVTGRRIQPT